MSRKKLTKHEASGEQKPIINLYSFMGIKGSYDTTDRAEYEAKLNGMNFADMQDYAIELNIKPSVNDDRERLTQKLLKAFDENLSESLAASERAMINPPDHLSSEVKNLLASGR